MPGTIITGDESVQTGGEADLSGDAAGSLRKIPQGGDPGFNDFAH